MSEMEDTVVGRVGEGVREMGGRMGNDATMTCAECPRRLRLERRSCPGAVCPQWRDPVTAETWEEIVARVNERTTAAQKRYFGRRITEPMR